MLSKYKKKLISETDFVCRRVGAVVTEIIEARPDGFVSLTRGLGVIITLDVENSLGHVSPAPRLGQNQDDIPEHRGLCLPEILDLFLSESNHKLLVRKDLFPRGIHQKLKEVCLAVETVGRPGVVEFKGQANIPGVDDLLPDDILSVDLVHEQSASGRQS